MLGISGSAKFVWWIVDFKKIIKRIMSSADSASFALENILKTNNKSDFVFFSVHHRLLYARQVIIKELFSSGGSSAQPPIFHFASFLTWRLDPGLLAGEYIIRYNYEEEEFSGLEEFYSIFLAHLVPGRKNVLIIEDLVLFLIFCSKALQPVIRLLRRLRTDNEVRVVSFYDPLTTTAETGSALWNEADTFFELFPDGREGSGLTFNSIVVKAGVGAKKYIEKASCEIDVVSGLIKTNQTNLSPTVVENKDELLRTLTTFKLTLEESERESKNNLYLPYFEAQRIPVASTEDLNEPDDDFDDDSEEI